MSDLAERIRQDAEERVLRSNDGNQEFLLYIDNRITKKGEKIDVVDKQFEVDRPAYLVFVDDEPGKNFGHRSHYLIYDAKTGEFVRKERVNFPHFFIKKSDSVELFRTCPTIEGYKRKKRLRILLEPGKLTGYAKIAPLPYKFWVYGTRYAILFSGGSNGRHVNDLEFLYRTLVDVYAYDPDDIYVLNYDGTANYNQMPWESAPAAGFGVDGSAYRMQADGRIVGQGTRAGFQNVITDLATRMGSNDCLLIHTNNHGWYDGNGGFLSAYSGLYYANDMAADLALLPAFKTLLVVMEQCASGSFAQPILNNSPASRTVFQAAVPGDESSAGGWPFDPWAEMWISAMAGVRGDGAALAVSPDDNLNNLISAWEAYDYALHIDNPVMSESSPGLSENVYLCRCRTSLKLIKEWKEPKEFKEIKEWKEPKELKEFKEPKEFKEIKELKELEPKIPYEPKGFSEPKLGMEPKAFEGPDWQIKFDQFQFMFEELGERFERLEEVMNRVEPFITKEERPEVKPRPRKSK